METQFSLEWRELVNPSRWSVLFILALISPLAAEPIQGSVRHGQQEIPVAAYAPESYQKGQTPPVLITLPPGPGTADMVGANLSNYWLAEGLKRGYIVVAPQIFGRSLDRDAGTFTDNLFRWLDGRLTYDRRKVVLTGQSNGGIGTFYMATTRPQRFLALLVLPGQHLGKPADLQKLRGKPIWMIVGEQDDPERWLKPCQGTFETLQQAGAKVKLDVAKGQGHVPSLPASLLFDWLDLQLGR